MIIENLFQTKIECKKDSDDSSYYNVNIDATDIRVEVTLTDFNGNPIIGKNVTLTVDRGTISSMKSGYTGTIASGGKSVTGATGTDGKLAIIYTASEWGLATFNANNVNIQINVTGWKQVVNQTDGKVQVYTDGENCQFSFQGSVSITANGNTNFTAIPSQYAPSQTITSQVHFQGHNISCMIDNEGNIGVHNASTSTTILMRVLVTYALKSKIIS